MSDYIIVYAVSEAHFRAVRGAIGQSDIVHLPPEPRTYDARIRERQLLAFIVRDLPSPRAIPPLVLVERTSRWRTDGSPLLTTG